jgi:hypothetical protein
MFYLEAGIPPLSAIANSQLDGLNAGHYGDGRILLGRINIRVIRLENETQLVVVFPKNPIASESVSRYVKAMKSAFASVAEGGSARSFSSTTRESLAADLRAVLAPRYVTRAREVATHMTKPAASVTTAADLLEERLHS